MTVVLLGPQRRKPTVAHALARLGVKGDVALVTAGWQEREGEAAELEEHLGCRALDLMLYRRAERILAEDPGLAQILRARQATLQDLQAVYRLRLGHALDALREIGRAAVGEKLRAVGTRAALRAVRRLDREHLRALARLTDRVARQIGPAREALVEQRDDIANRLRDTPAILIAGGHVAVLLNRLRLFDAAAWLAGRPVVAWAAGGMVLTERVVLFHDHPPQGPSDPEILDAGLGVVSGLVALPDAAQRLDLGDPERIGALAARFAPARSLALDAGAMLIAGPDGLLGESVRELDRSGRVREASSA